MDKLRIKLVGTSLAKRMAELYVCMVMDIVC